MNRFSLRWNDFPAINLIIDVISHKSIKEYDALLRVWAIKMGINIEIYLDIIPVIKKAIVKKYLIPEIKLEEENLFYTEDLLLHFLYQKRNKKNWGFSEKSWNKISPKIKSLLEKEFKKMEVAECYREWNIFKRRTTELYGIKWHPDYFLSGKDLVVRK